jgi:TATA-box binding protein (TBP) (component of TFIID and TFIIIB)
MENKNNPAYCPPITSNVVCTANIRVTLNITWLAAVFNGRESTTGFPCCTITDKSGRLTYQLFEGGKMVVTGAGTPIEGLASMTKLVAQLARLLKRNLRLYEFAPENIVAFGSLGYLFDQLKFFRDNQAADEPPKDYRLSLARSLNLATTTPWQEICKARLVKTPRKLAVTNKTRGKMRDSTFSQFLPGKFRGVQFFVDYPRVVILYSTGKYVVTGSADPEEILRTINAVDWSKWRLKPSVTLEQYTARVEAFANRVRRTQYGYHDFARLGLLCDVLRIGYWKILNSVERRSKFNHA